ncbi:autophagy-related protein 18g [Olea europaea var. sylvestris]|uniref:autophagy-related protein 18g n=1 Tax=Olea europaea var. sylvestris TaxID=158386 RepID=UPI000C1D13C5|nr:autophagy-related protein 18g [Olea europaea var. sylvestris]
MKKSKGKNSKLLPNSLRIISSCIKTVSTNASTAVRSAGATVAASISSSSDDRKEQVLWVGFDKLELGPAVFRRVLLLGYQNGFQVFDVEEASSLSELVSKRDGPVTFLQMLPLPAKCDGAEKYRSSYPLMVVVGGDEDDRPSPVQNYSYGCGRYGSAESQSGNSVDPPTAVRFYSLRSNVYVKVINFKSAVFMVRCSPRIVAVGLEEQIYCIDTITLEKKFTVLTYPVPRFGEQGTVVIGTGYGPMAMGSRWLAYPPSRPIILNTGRLSPKKLASSVSPSTSPGSSLMARYALESSKQLATGILTLGDMGYKKLSKYYPELLPDGSSSPGWKGGKLLTSEPEDAGVVVVKDVVSLEVISQFRAHTSPISALCFDPSGTLLVTASVHGNNINIFRIMPSQTRSESGCHDWNTSYVHLYKLHRGITTAVIQDICFSHDSQWIAIVSSKGTCHIFVLSPFGGDAGIQALHSHIQGTLYPFSSPPWWPTSSFAVNEKCSSPPPPCTLSVVSRIKSSDSGLLNSVSNAASSMAGKICVPSGALAVIFHSSKSSSFANVPSRACSLEHVLVYTPSGFVVQHELLSSVGIEVIDFKAETWSGPQAPTQNEELKVKAEPIQWWDVCRRSDNLEREECVFGSSFDGQNDPEIDDDSKTVFQEKESAKEKKLVQSDSFSSPERSHWYLSNAEVKINSSSLPVWQKTEIHFYVMEPSRAECYSGGEFEIEKVSSHEVEVRQKDLLPVFDHFPVLRTPWINRSVPFEGRYPNVLSSDPREKTNEASIICHSEPPSFSSTESSDGGSSRRIENLLDLEHMNIDKSPMHFSNSPSELHVGREQSTSLKTSIMDQRSGNDMPLAREQGRVDFNVDNNTTASMSCSSGNETPLLDADNTDSVEDILMPSGMEKTVDFGQFFKEGYCNKPDIREPHQTIDVENNQEEGSSSNSNDKEKTEDDEWIGGVFEFSEEG